MVRQARVCDALQSAHYQWLLFAPRRYNGVYSIAGLDPRTGHLAWQVPFSAQ